MAFPLQAEVKEWDECLAMLGEDEGATEARGRSGDGNSMELNGEGREINVSPLPHEPHDHIMLVLLLDCGTSILSVCMI
jgi:hypothetical protein